GGLPRIATGSAPTSAGFGACTAFTIVAACRLAEPPEAARCLEGFDGFVTSTAAPIATGWSDQLGKRLGTGKIARQGGAVPRRGGFPISQTSARQSETVETE